MGKISEWACRDDRWRKWIFQALKDINFLLPRSGIRVTLEVKRFAVSSLVLFISYFVGVWSKNSWVMQSGVFGRSMKIRLSRRKKIINLFSKLWHLSLTRQSAQLLEIQSYNLLLLQSHTSTPKSYLICPVFNRCVWRWMPGSWLIFLSILIYDLWNTHSVCHIFANVHQKLWLSKL